MPLRVAVIGAGAAGLVAARELRREGHVPIIFKRSSAVGGTWVYDNGFPSADPLGSGGTHSSLYASLRTTLPREVMGFLDFPFAAREGSDGDRHRYPGHAEVLRYLQELVRRFDLLGLVRLSTEVVSIQRDDGSTTSWMVSYRTKLPGAGDEEVEVHEEVFDAVVVCNGHFSEPRVADVAGIDRWPGKQIHCHNYRVPDPFRGQVVVVIEYEPSGKDISRDIASVAREVHVAVRSAPAHATICGSTQSTAHANLWLHSCMIESAEEDGSVVFQDCSRVSADTIVHCTGYKYNFQFIDDNEADVSVDDNRVGPLYKHVFPPKLAPRFSFIGLPFKAIPFPLFELQSKWVAGVLSGRIELPSQEEMMRDVTAFYSDLEARGCPNRHTHNLSFTFEYEDWLMEQCGLEKIEEWRKVIFVAARKNASGRPDSYRDEWDDDGHFLAQAYRDFSMYL